MYVNINRIMSVAGRLVESGHYASQQIKQIASQLEQEWKAFAAALDERSALLDMSSIFHQKAEKVSAQATQARFRSPQPITGGVISVGPLEAEVPHHLPHCTRVYLLLGRPGSDGLFL